MPPHPLTNLEIQKYQNEPRFNGVYSRDNLPKRNSTEIKDVAYVIILMSTLILEFIGLVCTYKIMMFLIW